MIEPNHKVYPRKDPRIQTIGPTVLTQKGVAVWHEGELVKIGVKGGVITMDYPTAFKVLGLMRYHAIQAKGFAGDKGKHWSTIAVLTDAEENDKRGF